MWLLGLEEGGGGRERETDITLIVFQVSHVPIALR